MSHKKPPRPDRKAAGRVDLDRLYTDDQWEFIRAMHALKLRLGRRPTDAEVLAEAKRLGYRR